MAPSLTVRSAAGSSLPGEAGTEQLRIVWLGRRGYQQTWQEQRALHAARVAGQVPDTLLLVEHDPVYTAGRRTALDERPQDGTPVLDVDRGGKITWHGPGQLVGYPVVALAAPVDVVAHVRRLEEIVLRATAELGFTGRRVEGRSGVWTTDSSRKVAAVGVRVAAAVTMHGFAINADCDLAGFGAIIPCGISDAGVTTLSRELGRPVGVADLLEPLRRAARAVLDR